MTVLRLKYVHRFKDRHGKIRYYLRRPGMKLVALPGAPGTPEFMAAYQAAISGPAVRVASRRQLVAGSLDALADAWYKSAPFRQLGKSTQAVYRRIVERLRSEHGSKLVTDIEAQHVRRLVADKAETPAAANHVLRLLRLMLDFAVSENWIRANPALSVKRLKEKADGAPTWTEADIRTFERHWPEGSQARLALTLLLYTGQRRSDVVRMGRHNLHNGMIQLKQVKTNATLLLPIHPVLEDALQRLPEGAKAFLTTEAGEPFSAGGFYNKFRDWVEAAGLPSRRSPHGLRKATARRLAEAGCTVHEIAAITGHKTLAEVERYTRAVDQERLASTAMARIDVANQNPGLPKTGHK